MLLYNKETRAAKPDALRRVQEHHRPDAGRRPGHRAGSGSYVGEAMLETLKPDEQRLVPFAVELGVHVLDNVASQDERISRVVIHNGSLQSRHAQVTRIRPMSSTTRAMPLLLPIWNIAAKTPTGSSSEPATAHEITESFWRFRFDLAPRGHTQFQVRTQRMLHQRPCPGRHFGEAVRALDRPAFPERADRGGHSPGDRAAAASGRVRGAGSPAGGRGKTIHTEQARVRENIKSLGDRASPRNSLRERFVRTFTVQEDRLEAIEKQIAAATVEGDKLRQQVAGLLARLNYEADLQGSAPAVSSSRKKKGGGEEGSAGHEAHRGPCRDGHLCG